MNLDYLNEETERLLKLKRRVERIQAARRTLDYEYKFALVQNGVVQNTLHPFLNQTEEELITTIVRNALDREERAAFDQAERLG